MGGFEMSAYQEEYLDDVVENQGKLFDLVAQDYPGKDTVDFINAYMSGKTRRSIDESQAYVNTMDARTLWDYFCRTEEFELRDGRTLEGFMPRWIGEFYAYYQWYYDVSSSELVKRVPVSFLMKTYAGLGGLDLDLAVRKIGKMWS